MTIRSLALLGLAVLLLPTAFTSSAEAQSYNGDWEVASGLLYGKLIPDNVVQTMTLNLAEDTFTAKSGNLTSKGSLSSDDSTSPAQITFTINGGDDSGRELKGIWRMDGNSLRITFSEDSEYPTSFDSSADNKYLTLNYRPNSGRNTDRGNLANNNNNNNARNRSRARNQPGARPRTAPTAPTESGAQGALPQ